MNRKVSGIMQALLVITALALLITEGACHSEWRIKDSILYSLIIRSRHEEDIIEISNSSFTNILSISAEVTPLRNATISDSIINWFMTRGNARIEASDTVIDRLSAYDNSTLYLYDCSIGELQIYDNAVVYIFTSTSFLEDLISDVEDMNLQQGIDNSLDAKLSAVIDALESVNADQRNDALNKLYAFINEVEAQRGKKITEEQADYLKAKVQAIIDLLQG